ncbi:MAG: hypothetical protein M1824_004930 [Vezdaea acicularis]|nr:MAG: hypothetical protein M1824_004930 [Vezdaea acicularis]
MARSWVHLMPVGVSIVLIAYNLKGWYIGQTLDGKFGTNRTKLAALQVAAKIQELLVTGSLASIVSHIIQYKLCFGDGIPLGLLSSGYHITQLHFLWSSELWGSVESRPFRQLFKQKLIALLIVFVIVLVLVGPASAVLMIPSTKWWWAGGTSFYLQGSEDDLWPSNLTQAHTGGPECTTGVMSNNNHRCMSGGYPAILNHIMALQPPSQGRPNGGFSMLTQDTGIRKNIHGAIRYGGTQRDTWAVDIHAATAAVSGIVGDGYNMAKSQAGGQYWRYIDGPGVGYVDVQLPAVRTACSPFKMYHQNDSSMAFPVMPQVGPWAPGAAGFNAIPLDGPIEILNFTDVFKNMWVSFGKENGTYSIQNDSSVRTEWVILPRQYGWVTSGLAFFGPALNNGTARIGAGCAIDARWFQGMNWADWDYFEGAISSTMKAFFIESDPPTAQNVPEQWFSPDTEGNWRSIGASSDWLQTVSPKIDEQNVRDDGSPQLTTLENILNAGQLNDNSNLQNPNYYTPYLEYMLSITTADAISRVGWVNQEIGNTSALYDNVPDSPLQFMHGGNAFRRPSIPGVPFTELRMRARVQGYAFHAETITEYGAIAVLSLYLLIAMTHILVLYFWKSRTSICWDTSTELLALALNSKPAPNALGNTCTGIRRFKTMAQKAKVREVDNGGEELQLVFNADSDGKLLNEVDCDKEYGASN